MDCPGSSNGARRQQIGNSRIALGGEVIDGILCNLMLDISLKRLSKSPDIASIVLCRLETCASSAFNCSCVDLTGTGCSVYAGTGAAAAGTDAAGATAVSESRARSELKD